MRIATYNILKGGSKRVHWTQLIHGHAVDLLLAQESYSHHEHLPAIQFPDAPRRTAWKRVEQRSWGSAVFSMSGSVKPIPVRGYSGWVVGAEIENAFWHRDLCNSILVFSVHVPARGEPYWK